MWTRFRGPGGTDFRPRRPLLFIRSPYYWELPIQDVSVRISADPIVKCPDKERRRFDTQHLATAIPVAQYVVADKAMVDRCERLGIGKKWNTRLYSTRRLDDLCDELAALP